MSKDNKIIYFNDVANKRKVSNLKLFSGVLKNNVYKLVKRFLPYIVGAPLFLGIMHFGGGYSLEHGKIMQEYSFENDDYDNFSDDRLIYRGPWSKDENGYSRVVNVYNAEIMNNELIHDALMNKEKMLDTMAKYLIFSNVENFQLITLEEEYINNSIMEYFDYERNDSKYYANVGLTGVAGYVFEYSAIQLLVYFLYRQMLVIHDENKNKLVMKRRSGKK